MPFTRRDFLKGTAVGLAATAVAGRLPGFEGPVKNALALAEQRDAEDERWVPTVCLQCPGTCGLLVRVVGGRAVKIEGNPHSPVSRGRLCPKGQAGLQVLYDPDRLKGPMRRIGERGEGKWQRITWDEALGEVAARLAKLRNEGLSHTVVQVAGRRQAQMTALWERFMKAYGSPNAVRRGALCSAAGDFGYGLVQGVEAHQARDWGNANYVLAFGYPWLEASRPLTYNLGEYGKLRRGKPTRGKFVLVDPRYGISAQKADEYIPIRPGTDAAFALALAHVIIKEELYDKDFIANHTQGFEKFREMVLAEYSPEQAETICGIPAATTVRIARELASTKPASVDAGDRGTSAQTNGVYTRMAIHSLNALLGTIDAPGGLLVQRKVPLKAWPPLVQDEISKQGAGMVRIDEARTAKWPFAGHVWTAAWRNMAAGQPYPVNLLFVYYANPLFNQPERDVVKEAMTKVPFVVDFSPFMSESAAYADLILPDHTFLERYQYVDPAEGPGIPHVSLRQPVVKPLYDTMDTSDVLIRLAKMLGGTVAQSFPWADTKALIDFTLSGLNPDQLKELRETGVLVQRRDYPFKDYKKSLPTRSGKFEFVSSELKEKFEKVKLTDADLERMKIAARGDKVFMPHYEPVRYTGGSAAEYPFVLNTYKLAVRPEGRGGNQPWLVEIYGLQHGIRWDTWVEIHPDDARELGIATGDEVVVESVAGKITTRAVLVPGVRGTVHIPHGLGHRGYGRWAKGTGVNPNDLGVIDFDYLKGQSAWHTRVKVYKA